MRISFYGSWIKMHRKLMDSKVFDNEKMLKFWVWALLKAQHQQTEIYLGYQQITLQPGEFVFGRIAAAEDLKMGESVVYRILSELVKLGNLNIKSTNKFSIISIRNWSLYQIGEQQKDNKKTTKKQQKDTYKNGENEKNDKKPLTPRERGDNPRSQESNPRSVKAQERETYEKKFYEEHGFYPPV